MKAKSLSTKSLKRVWDWCEQNPNPLSECYMAACGTVGCYDPVEIRRTLDRLGMKSSPAYARSVAVSNAAYSCRDIIGRIILDLIKSHEAERRKAQS